MEKFYANGKLLLTGEYVVLDGAKALAVPTKFGQDLVIEPIQESQLIWGSFTHTGVCWFEATFDLPKLRLTSATFNSKEEGSAEFIAETLQGLLQEARRLNPSFLQSPQGFVVKTNLGFPRDWGLGSSSTLIQNIATWANVNPYELLWNAFSGSGYDIACAKHNTPILYQVQDRKPKVEEIEFFPSFVENLYFIHLNKKQDSRAGIQQYKAHRKSIKSRLKEIDQLTVELLNVQTIENMEEILIAHENIIGSIIQQEPIQKRLFSDYFGVVKSLGAWGGDFILATGNEATPKYFAAKGFTTIIPYQEMIL